MQLAFRFKDPITDKFLEFHRDNPEVYALFKKFAFQLIRVGHKHYSADGIMHQVRYHTSLKTTDPKYKINNNYVAYYARLFRNDFPEHKDFFETRKVRG